MPIGISPRGTGTMSAVPSPRAHRVAVVALDGVVAADLAVPGEVLGRVVLPGGRRPYEIQVVSPRRAVDAGLFELRVPHRLDVLAGADTIVVPGRADPLLPTPAAVIDELIDAFERGVRLVSICVGAFILAEAGVLDGLRATTHWAAAPTLAERHPDVEVDADALFVDNGQVLTSAGAAAGFDALLHLVERDHGHAVAAEAARAVVMPLARRGGQAQFIAPRPRRDPPTGIAPILEWIEANLEQPLTLADIATRAAMSQRTLHRRFVEQVGCSPLRWVGRARIQRAQHLLETTDEPVETIAYAAGFGSPITFREQFGRHVGTSPREFRRSFRASPTG